MLELQSMHTLQFQCTRIQSISVQRGKFKIYWCHGYTELHKGHSTSEWPNLPFYFTCDLPKRTSVTHQKSQLPFSPLTLWPSPTRSSISWMSFVPPFWRDTWDFSFWTFLRKHKSYESFLWMDSELHDFKDEDKKRSCEVNHSHLSRTLHSDSKDVQ